MKIHLSTITMHVYITLGYQHKIRPRLLVHQLKGEEAVQRGYWHLLLMLLGNTKSLLFYTFCYIIISSFHAVNQSAVWYGTTSEGRQEEPSDYAKNCWRRATTKQETWSPTSLGKKMKVIKLLINARKATDFVIERCKHTFIISPRFALHDELSVTYMLTES